MSDLTSFIELLQSRIQLSSIISEDVKLTRKNNHQYVGLCPFHKERTGSFSVNDDKNLYHCFGCGASGNVFNYLEAKRSLTFMAALEMLAHRQGLTIPKKTETNQVQDNSYQILSEAALWFEENLAKSIAEGARDYLKSRNINPEIQKIFKLGFAPSSSNAFIKTFSPKYSLEELIRVGLVVPEKNIDRFRSRIMFPICDRQGRIIAFGGRVLDQTQPKYLNSSDTPLFSKSHILYGQHIASKYISNNQGYVIVEGYLDVISLYANGIQTAIAPLGTALTEHHLQLLWRHKIPPLLCFDGDTAGYNAAIRSAKKALPFLTPEKRLNFLFLPHNEDPDSLIRKNKDLFFKLLKEPTPLSHVLWKNLCDETPLKTPEDQALLKQKILALTNIITDINVKQSYIQYFNDQLFIKKKSKNTYKSIPILSHVKKDSLIILQKIILATLLYHPYLISQVMDLLMNVSLVPPLNKIREFLIGYSGELEKEKIKSTACAQGVNIETILDLAILNKAPFIKQQDAELVLSGWKEIYNRLEYVLNLESEVKTASQVLKQKFEENNWNRIKELQSLKLRSQIENE